MIGCWWSNVFLPALPPAAEKSAAPAEQPVVASPPKRSVKAAMARSGCVILLAAAALLGLRHCFLAPLAEAPCRCSVCLEEVSYHEASSPKWTPKETRPQACRRTWCFQRTGTLRVSDVLRTPLVAHPYVFSPFPVSVGFVNL